MAPPKASQPGGSHGFILWRTQRQYANSKLAQILHARALQRKLQASSSSSSSSSSSLKSNLSIVSVCPAWVATQIAVPNGTLAHAMFSQFAFPVNGYGIASVWHALFDDHVQSTNQHLQNDNHHQHHHQYQYHQDYYVNIDLVRRIMVGLEVIPPVVCRWTPVCDLVGWGGSMIIFHLQRFVPKVMTTQASHISYDEQLQDDLYQWSYQAIREWL